MTLDLRPLMTEENRRQLWLAEVAGLLHQVGKLTKEFVENPAGGFPFEKLIDLSDSSVLPLFKLQQPPQRLTRSGLSVPQEIQSWLKTQDIAGISLADILLLYFVRQLQDKWSGLSAVQWQVVPTLFQAHDLTSGLEKQAADLQNVPGLAQQTAPFFVSSAFGFENVGSSSDQFEIILQDVLKVLKEKLPGGRQKRKDLYEALGPFLLQGMGDTRRPINDVTLWDISASVAALYKAALAQTILEGCWKDPGTQRWRFLRVGVDQLAFAERASRIPAVLGRMRVLDEALDEVRTFLEETCPVGNEIYRDETGSVFIIPALDEDLLSGTLESGQTLREQIDAIFSEKTSGEILPHLYDERLPNLAEIRQKPVSPPRRDIGQLMATWPDSLRAEKCVVCGLRPHGGGGSFAASRQDTARARHLCVPCLDRSVGRVQDWLEGIRQSQPQATIWVDEASDVNGRCALLVGRFVLDHWLDGEMVKTLALGKNDKGEWLSKNPSFARIRRVWETTKQFWEMVRQDTAEVVGHAPRSRWKLVLNSPASSSLVGNHVYEIDVHGRPFPLVWDGSALVTIENLDYAANSRGIREDKLRGVLTRLFAVYEPGSYGGRRRKVTDITVMRVEDHSMFTPMIPITAEPSLFMAIMPAGAALKAARSIEERYAKEMGKVRNRLPLHIGLVFFPRKTPVIAVVDAARRFLTMPQDPEPWTVKSAKDGCVEFANGIVWNIPLTMGDRTTKDLYYPFFLAPASAGSTDPSSEWRQNLSLDGVKKEYLLTHMSKLQAGRSVFVWPSHFDFQWLGSTTDRFHIVYGDEIKRPRRRPYYLEELRETEPRGRLSMLWDILAGADGLTSSQIRQVFDIQETHRARWGQASSPDAVLVRLARDLWSTAEWRQRPRPDELEQLAQASADGTLADVIELFMGILKKRPVRDTASRDAETAPGERATEGVR